jgi:hypothetical protein
LVLFGCQGGETAVTSPESAQFARGGNGGGKGGPPKEDGGGDIPLSVVFRDAAGDGLASDGGGAYEDEVDRVLALIKDPSKGDVNSHGTLRFTAASLKGKQQAVRAVNVAVTSRDGSEVLFQGAVDAGFSTFNDPHGGSPADFTQITAGQSQAMVLKVRWDDSNGTSYTLRFGRDCDAVLVPANRVTVDGLASPPDAWSWRVHSSGDAILCDAQERLASVPFSMVMTEQP